MMVNYRFIFSTTVFVCSLGLILVCNNQVEAAEEKHIADPRTATYNYYPYPVLSNNPVDSDQSVTSRVMSYWSSRSLSSLMWPAAAAVIGGLVIVVVIVPFVPFVNVAAIARRFRDMSVGRNADLDWLVNRVERAINMYENLNFVNGKPSNR